MMIVTEITSSMIVPSGCAVYESRWVKRFDDISETKLRISLNDLSPALVIDDLQKVSKASLKNKFLPM